MTNLNARAKKLCWVIGTKSNGPRAAFPYDSIERMFEEGEAIAMEKAVRACGLVYFTIDGYRFADNLQNYTFEETEWHYGRVSKHAPEAK